MSVTATLLDSTDEVRDADLLRRRMQKEGYLYFSRLFEPKQAEKVKQDIMSILRQHYIIEDDDAQDPMWSGGPRPTEAEYMAVYDRIVRLDSFQQLARTPEIIAVLEALCEEPVQVWEQQLVRLVYPDPETVSAQGVGAHQDGDPKLGYRTSRFYTCWLALMDIESTVGGLAVAPGSHCMGLLESTGTVASSTRKTDAIAYGLDAGKLVWATTDYAPGSSVVFTSLMAHRGLPNHSERIRLSCDFRYQAARDTASWLAHTPGPDVRRTAQQIDEILAGRALYVTTRATPEVLDQVRRGMLEERSTSLACAQKLVWEIQEQGSNEG